METKDRIPPEGDEPPSPKKKPLFANRTWRRIIIAVLSAATILIALGYAAYAVRSCTAEAKELFRSQAETRIYEYGTALSGDSRIILATKTSGFVIPRDFVKKLILGIKSTAKIEIACAAVIHFTIDAEDLRSASYAWSGKNLTMTVKRPRPMRPVIETSSIRQAILHNGLAFNERAELDKLVSELSDIVAADPAANLDDAILETCRTSLEGILEGAFSGARRAPAGINVKWKE
jgi:hypothetical protein